MSWLKEHIHTIKDAKYWGFEKGYYIRIYEIGQGNDWYLISRSKKLIRQAKRELEALFKECVEKVRKTDDVREQTLLWEEFSDKLNMMFEENKDFDIILEDDNNYIFDTDVMIATAKFGNYYAYFYGNVYFY
jgi:hypothetical protein